MIVWNWRFRGFVTPSGKKPVQKWFTELPDEDAKNDARDKLGMMQKIGNHLWHRPEFDQLDDGISEIRFNGPSGTYRIYGYFGPKGERQSYTFLNGVQKKKRRDSEAQDLAAKRRDQIEREEATIHEFEFHERIDPASSPGAGSSGELRGLSAGQIYRFPNSSPAGSEGDESN